ncbi:Abhydrolase family protein [Novipirellula galeiformis]|uniref:Abhydrolase family protein n=1 Tax=Novipirellula galeiformis TaxID=2528004 RepID=A0A5C6CQ53_9BACT|nr:alpha/beta hydrolase family protein [Novipirellula galeiformis]TWU25216.1 Abhydrolase family protein [Novipirellula galeiformis]
MKKTQLHGRGMARPATIAIAVWMFALVMPAFGQKLDINKERVIQSGRPDGRHVSTRGFQQHLLRNAKPKLAFNPEFTSEEFEQWRSQVRAKLLELMNFPELVPQPPPHKLWTQEREGYVLEKWELYPEPGSVVPFLVLIPENATADKPAPAIMCIPGSSGTKENLAGEPPLAAFKPDDRNHDGWLHSERNQQAVQFARAGFVAVAVDHPGTGELSDLAKYRGSTMDDRSTLSRYLIDMGRNFIALSVFQKRQILTWLREQPHVDAQRVAVSGHSLGTEPLLVLAVLDPQIQGIVWNDYLAATLQRAKVSTMPNQRGVRPAANWLGHSIPGLWEWFDYPDLVAAFAPRPLIVTEGGPTHSLNLVRKAYQIAGASENVSIHYYPKYSDPADRRDGKPIPEGLNATEWLDHANVNAAHHYFKGYLAIPWLSRQFQLPEPSEDYPPAPPEAVQALQK